MEYRSMIGACSLSEGQAGPFARGNPKPNWAVNHFLDLYQKVGPITVWECVSPVPWCQ